MATPLEISRQHEIDRLRGVLQDKTNHLNQAQRKLEVAITCLKAISKKACAKCLSGDDAHDALGELSLWERPDAN